MKENGHFINYFSCFILEAPDISNIGRFCLKGAETKEYFISFFKS